MIKFDSHPHCKLCPLWESAENPGIETRLYKDFPTLLDRALLIVGQNPGYREDRANKSWVGYSGVLTSKFITASNLLGYCDVYLSNACRCKPPQGGSITQSNITKCRGWLEEDVAKLQAKYKEVILFAFGAKGCHSISKITSLNDALKNQGSRSPFFQDAKGEMPRMFFTNHPAMLHPTRNPSLVHAVEAHFLLLQRFLSGKYIPNELDIVPEVGIQVPIDLPKRVSCDIETYGILKGQEQTVFNPIKSKEIDGIPFDKQIITVSFAWRESSYPFFKSQVIEDTRSFKEVYRDYLAPSKLEISRPKLKTALYVWSNLKHRRIIREWFRVLSQKKHIIEPLVGQNIKFDLMYLASADDELRYWIDPRRLKLDDTLLMSFLYYEQQPEKGLKALAALFGIADYSGVRVTGKSGTAKDPWDPNLHYYNCLDAAVTLVLYEQLEQMIIEKYGTDTPKTSPVCAWMRNITIWDTFDLDINGSALDIGKLIRYHQEERGQCEIILRRAENLYDLKFEGTGSDKPLREFMLKCIKEADLLIDPRVKWSEKTKKISIGVENINLVKQHMPEGKLLEMITLFQEFKERSKIMSTYTGPLLFDQRKGIVSRNGNIGMVYPSWYPFPSEFTKGGKGKESTKGQKQGRFSCSKPARMTEPYSIRKCSTTRWPGGKLLECDVSQDHLRMAALLSGDSLLMDSYLNPFGNVHTQSARMIFPDADTEAPGWKKSDEYQLGKNLNFIVLFRGGAGAYQREVLSVCNLEVEFDFCQNAIQTWWGNHLQFKAWQEEAIVLAAKQGYLISPTGWGRTFPLGKEGCALCIPEICNVLLQLPCAQVTQSAQYKVINQFRKYNLRSVVCLQIYDAIFTDIYPGEASNVREIVMEAMTHPPLLPILEQSVGRTLPWLAEFKEYEL